MFQSATLKLTAWYVGIIMIISVCFSLAIFQISRNEVDNRLSRYQGIVEHQFPSFTDQDSLRFDESARASLSLALRLVYLNIGVLLAASVASYFLARRTLKPVEEAHETEVRFVSDASHELRTPLAIMKSELELALRDSSITKSELKEILVSNLEEVNNLSALSETLLMMAKLDQDVTTSPADAAELAHQAIERMKQPDGRITIHSSGKATVVANKDLLREAIVILLDNAIKYSPARSTVRVRVGARKSEVIIVVENDGDGIAESDLDHIFDRFYRADRSRTSHESSKGLGLGLSLAKQIIDLHNGHITATSGVNQTTTFSISLPKANPIKKL